MDAQAFEGAARYGNGAPGIDGELIIVYGIGFYVGSDGYGQGQVFDCPGLADFHGPGDFYVGWGKEQLSAGQAEAQRDIAGRAAPIKGVGFDSCT